MECGVWSVECGAVRQRWPGVTENFNRGGDGTAVKEGRPPKKPEGGERFRLGNLLEFSGPGRAGVVRQGLRLEEVRRGVHHCLVVLRFVGPGELLVHRGLPDG